MVAGRWHMTPPLSGRRANRGPAEALTMRADHGAGVAVGPGLFVGLLLVFVQMLNFPVELSGTTKKCTGFFPFTSIDMTRYPVSWLYSSIAAREAVTPSSRLREKVWLQLEPPPYSPPPP